MTAFLVGLMVGLVVGLPLGALAVHFDLHSRATKPAAEKPQKSMTYGHPWAPVPALRKRLPHAPSGHAWEIRVQHNDKGVPFLYLSLLNLASGKPVAEKKRNLIDGTLGTWASEYRRYGSIKDRIFDRDLLGPFVDWAAATFNQYANANAVGEYIVETP